MEKENIYTTINKVVTEISKVGIGKNQNNNFDKYKFRGIDDLYNVLCPILAETGLVIIPNVCEKEIEQTTTQKGGKSYFVRVKVAYTLANTSGDYIVTDSYGEGTDRGDKGINKALTSAYKNLCFQMFCIPVETNQDSEFPEEQQFQDHADWPKLEPYITQEFADYMKMDLAAIPVCSIKQIGLLKGTLRKFTEMKKNEKLKAESDAAQAAQAAENTDMGPNGF